MSPCRTSPSQGLVGFRGTEPGVRSRLDSYLSVGAGGCPCTFLGPLGTHRIWEVGVGVGGGCCSAVLFAQGTNGSQIWDTAFAIQALLEVCGSVPHSPASTCSSCMSTPASSRTRHLPALTLRLPGLQDSGLAGSSRCGAGLKSSGAGSPVGLFPR